MDRFTSPSKVMFNGPSYMTNSKDVRSPTNPDNKYQSIHQQISVNSPSFKFQSPQIKRTNNYPLESSNNVNGSLNFTPISERNVYSPDKFAKTQPINIVIPDTHNK